MQCSQNLPNDPFVLHKILFWFTGLFQNLFDPWKTSPDKHPLEIIAILINIRVPAVEIYILRLN